MDPNVELRRSVRGFYAWVGAFLIAAGLPFLASYLSERASPGERIGGVVIGTFAWIPMILVLARVIRTGDEFNRRIHLVAIAIAFACAMEFISLLDWLTRAHFIVAPPFAVIWLVIALLWAVALFAVKHHYTRAP